MNTLPWGLFGFTFRCTAFGMFYYLEPWFSKWGTKHSQEDCVVVVVVLEWWKTQPTVITTVIS